MANAIIPDHDANVFNPPSGHNSTQPAGLNKVVGSLLGGYKRWDSIHFLHVAQYGYVYEQSVAFFPLFPLSVRYTSKLLINPILNLNMDEATLLSSLILNLICFTSASVYLYKLTRLLFHGNRQLSKLAVYLFCINPATIFFCASYSESMYSMFTFSGLYHLISYRRKRSLIDYALSLFLFLAACLTRSNGTLNYLYVAFFLIRETTMDLVQNNYEYFKLKFYLSKKLAELLMTMFVFILPLSLYQFYVYQRFCSMNTSDDHEDLPSAIVEYGRLNSFHLFSDKRTGALPHWCNSSVPFSYTAIQSKYWNVGFLKYWTFRQIPNFLLATPLLFLSIMCTVKYLRTLGVGKSFVIIRRIVCSQTLDSTHSSLFNGQQADLLPFHLHLLCLVASSLFFMHVQVRKHQQKTKIDIAF